ncbi:MAG TPA: hypothetical protein VMU37_07585, partial [Caulobacteraceae bacterium]|nr:hypothetical protein [Caulobacteraceae bacterium]
NAVSATAGLVSLGQMNEFCNDANGYQVWVQYSPSLAGDTLTVGDQQIVLDDSGSVMIDASAGPASTKKSVSLAVPAAGVSGTLSVRVVSL